MHYLYLQIVTLKNNEDSDENGNIPVILIYITPYFAMKCIVILRK